MDKWICIAVCILISVLIYYLLKSYGINNIIEGQCAGNDSGICNFNYDEDSSAQNICNSIIDPTTCGDVPKYRIPCTDICDSPGDIIPNVSPIPLSTFNGKSAPGICCETVSDDPWDCTDLPDATGSCNCRFAKAKTFMTASGFEYSKKDYGEKIGNSNYGHGDCCNNFAQILTKYLDPFAYRDEDKAGGVPYSTDGCKADIDTLISNYNIIYNKIYGEEGAPCHDVTLTHGDLPHDSDFNNFANAAGWSTCCNDRTGPGGLAATKKCRQTTHWGKAGPTGLPWIQNYPNP